jgi:hypothetical protein
MTIQWYDVVSWLATAVSLTLFIQERKRNEGRKYYMVLQGILRACSKRVEFLSHLVGRADRNPQREISHDEYMLLISTQYSNNIELMEIIMGAMKAIEPDKDIPFDVTQFLQSNHIDSNQVDVNT